MPAGIQNVRRSLIFPLFGTADVGQELARFENAFITLAQQVAFIQNQFQILTVAIGGGVTSVAVTLTVPSPTGNYLVAADFFFSNGGYWTTGKSKTAFTLHWVTASPGSGNLEVFVVQH